MAKRIKINYVVEYIGAISKNKIKCEFTEYTDKQAIGKLGKLIYLKSEGITLKNLKTNKIILILNHNENNKKSV